MAVDVEKSENTVELVAIAIIAVVVLYVLYKVINTGNDTAKKLIDLAKCNLNMKGTLTPGKNKWQGHALTPLEAEGVASILNHACAYTLSPDHMQVWFYDGSYYCNRDGHLHDFCGKDEGCLIYAAGCCLKCNAGTGPCMAEVQQ